MLTMLQFVRCELYLFSFRRGSVFAGHNNGSVTMFVKQEGGFVRVLFVQVGVEMMVCLDGFWDWDNYRTVEPGERKDVPVGAMLNVRDVVWVALDRKVYEINTKSFQVSVCRPQTVFILYLVCYLCACLDT